MNKLTDIKGKKIYSGTDYIGDAQDILIDPDKGEIEYLVKGEPSTILKKEKTEAKEFIKENFIPFEKVQAIKDIIVLEGE